MQDASSGTLVFSSPFQPLVDVIVHDYTPSITETRQTRYLMGNTMRQTRNQLQRRTMKARQAYHVPTLSDPCNLYPSVYEIRTLHDVKHVYAADPFHVEDSFVTYLVRILRVYRFILLPAGKMKGYKICGFQLFCPWIWVRRWWMP